MRRSQVLSQASSSVDEGKLSGESRNVCWTAPSDMAMRAFSAFRCSRDPSKVLAHTVYAYIAESYPWCAS